MKLRQIDKNRYRKHYKIVFAAIVIELIAISLVSSTLLINWLSSPDESHFILNLAGVVVIGVSDAVRGEIVKAFILPKAGVRPDNALKESIRNYVKTRLEAHAYPRAVVFLKEMPMTKTGKILKQELRRMHEAGV